MSWTVCSKEEEGCRNTRLLLFLCLIETRCKPPQPKDSFQVFLSMLTLNPRCEVQAGHPSSCLLRATHCGTSAKPQKVMKNSSPGAARAEMAKQSSPKLPIQYRDQVWALRYPNLSHNLSMWKGCVGWCGQCLAAGACVVLFDEEPAVLAWLPAHPPRLISPSDIWSTKPDCCRAWC